MGRGLGYKTREFSTDAFPRPEQNKSWGAIDVLASTTSPSIIGAEEMLLLQPITQRKLTHGAKDRGRGRRGFLLEEFRVCCCKP